MSRTRRRATAGALLMFVAGVPAASRADEPRLASEPMIMREPGEVVDVVDAFDDGDPFDIHIDLGFGFRARWASLGREDASGKTLDDLHFRSTTALLVPRIEVGLYRDLALTATLPIELSNTETIERSDGKSGTVNDASGAALFSAPFHGPDRSGPEYLALGADVGIMNQARHAALPTWMAGFEIRVPVGESLHACNAKPPAGEVACAAPSDVDRNGSTSGTEPKGIHSLTPGVDRGTVGIELHTFLSRRVLYFEPYGGLRGLVEVPIGASDFANVAGAGGGKPPVMLEASVGTLFIPWENREHFGRISLDLRVSVSAHTAGADITELYDALGSSDAPSVRVAPSGVLPFTGITRAAAYPAGKIGGEVIWQTGSYVKLGLGLAGDYDGNHAITESEPSGASSRAAFTGFVSTSRFGADVNARVVGMF